MIRILSALLLSFAATVAWGQAWPSKPVRLIVPYPPGGLTDVLARGLSAEIAKT